MFKSRKKKQQLKEAAAAAALQANTQSEIKSEIETPSKYKLLDDIHLVHDFRSSIILPQLNKDLDPTKLSKQQLHLAQLRDIPESPTMTTSPPLSPPPMKDLDGTKQYQELAAWRHQRSQNRYSNGLFGGKQRGRPKPNQLRKLANDHEEDDIAEEDTEEDKAPAITNNELPTPPLMATNAPLQSIINLIQEEADNSENEDEDDIEEEDDELLEESYEPNSDTEENFFFQDFSSTTPPLKNKKKSGTRRKSRSNKVMSKFDLSSFARDLHENRLSVMVQRESRIIMTEDDENELEKLLERQRQRMSMMSTMVNESSESLVPPPPMPSLDLIKTHKAASTATVYRPASPEIASAKLEVELTQNTLEVPHMNSDHGSTTTTDSCASNEDQDTQEITLKDDVPQKFTTPTPVASLSSSKSSNSIGATTTRPSLKMEDDQLKRSVSTNSVQSNVRSNNAPLARKASNISNKKNREQFNAARKSVSMDDIHINLKENEHSVTSAALDWINQTENTTPLNPISDPTSFVYKQGTTPLTPAPAPQLTKSRSLFGSLRQVSRSKSHHHSGNGGIKGLVRNFSSHHKPSSTNSTNVADAGMSRAAMAVIQHNVAKQEKQKATPVIPEERTKSESTTAPQIPKRRSRSKSDANANNLISHLISRAASSRKHNGTKIVNMENDDTAAAKKRAQVVRKTIIYVQPDSLHNLLKNGGDGSSIKVPPMPSKINTAPSRNTLALSDGSLSPDDETIRSREYVTATKIVRQTSVRKRVVEDNTAESKLTSSGSSSPLSETSTLLERQGSANQKKRYQLQSVDEHDLLDVQQNKHASSSSSGSSSDSNSNHNNEYMEGLELREMSDGSVVWGLVKKQGNRKSFFAPNQLQHGRYDHVDDEDTHEEADRHLKQPPSQPHNNSLSPPPIPKRSPRRQVAPAAPTTDVYYSNQVNLPNLLKMMYDQQQQQQQHPGDDDDDQYENEFNERAMSSVDDQLDEMMRILTSQQQQVRQH